MRFIDRIRTWWAAASAIVLLTVAVLGIVYDVLHRFRPSEFLRLLGTPEEVLILLVSLLCGGLGAERLLTLRKIETSIEEASTQRANILKKVNSIWDRLGRLQSKVTGELLQVEKKEGDLFNAVNKINKAESLIGTKAVEDAARRLVEECSDNDDIKATSQYRTEEGLSEKYFQTIADRVKRAKQNQGDMEYRVIVPISQDSESKLEDKRKNAFHEEDIEDRLITKHAKHPWPLEVLIGGRSMIIALRGGRQRPTYEVAVKITDPEFVEKASEWFREVAWGEADKDS